MSVLHFIKANEQRDREISRALLTKYDGGTQMRQVQKLIGVF